MNIESYLSELVAALQRRGADSSRISELVEEVERTLKSSGEDADPAAEFGLPEDYAEQLIARDEQTQTSTGGTTWVQRTFRATAFDEMKVLADAGRQGWELVDVGFYALHCRRPNNLASATEWEYERRVSVDRQGILADMSELGWESCGVWLPFHYFKRDLKQPALLPR